MKAEEREEEDECTDGEEDGEQEGAARSPLSLQLRHVTEMCKTSQWRGKFRTKWTRALLADSMELFVDVMEQEDGNCVKGSYSVVALRLLL